MITGNFKVCQQIFCTHTFFTSRRKMEVRTIIWKMNHSKINITYKLNPLLKFFYFLIRLAKTYIGWCKIARFFIRKQYVTYKICVNIVNVNFYQTMTKTNSHRIKNNTKIILFYSRWLFCKNQFCKFVPK